MRKFIALILVAILVVGVVGCSKSVEGDKYIAKTCELLGFETDISEVYKEEFSIILGEKGKGSMSLEGRMETFDYTLIDGVFNTSVRGYDISGTIVDDVLTIENMLGSGISVKLIKEK